MSEPRRRYLSYLLRLWQVTCEGGLAWRASLESARTGERRGFASLDELFIFLQERVTEGDALTAEVALSSERCVPSTEIHRQEKRR